MPAKTAEKHNGISSDAVQIKTGKDWPEWFRILDAAGGKSMDHKEIVAVVSKHGVGSWWRQMVTVGYERIKGLRAKGQQRNGTYGATKSRTFPVPVATLFEAWLNPKMRRRWLKDETVRVRTATVPKSMRLDWTDGSIIAVGFTAKGKVKSAVALEHTKLPDRDAVARVKQEWAERLEALGAALQDV